MPDAVKVHPTLPHHVTGSSQHGLITSQHDNKRIKFTVMSDPHNKVTMSVTTAQEAVIKKNSKSVDDPNERKKNQTKG